MSFENFDFEIVPIDLLKIFGGSETMPKTGKKYGNTAREVVYDFLYDYGVRSDGIEVIETTGFTRVKLVFCHSEGIFEFFQNHKWEMAEKWRVKTSQKHLAPIMILPGDEKTIYLDFFNGARNNPSLQKALKSLQRQGDSGSIFSPGLDMDGDPLYLDAGKNILAGGALGSGTASLVRDLIVQSICNAPENIPTLVLIDPQGIDLSVFERLPNVYGQNVFCDVKETEEIFEELSIEIRRRKKLMKEAAAETVAEYNRHVSRGLRLRQIVVIFNCFNRMWDCSEEKFRIKNTYEKLKILMQDACAVGISFVLFTQRELSEQFCSALDWNLWQTLFEIKIACRTSDQFFSTKLIGSKEAEYLTGNRDLLCVSKNGIQHLQQYYISMEEIEKIKNTIAKCD